MQISLAGVPSGGTSGVCKRERELNSFWDKRLWTYYWLNKNKGKMPTTKNKVELMLDSGAFSAWNQGGKINLQEYITFCLENLSFCDYIVNLDVIPGKPYQKVTKQDIDNSVKQGWNNYITMLQAGIPKEKLIHVFHQGENMEELKKMVKQIPYIGLSPANDKTTDQKTKWLDRCMKYVVDSNGFPLVKFHGFGVTSLFLMLRYPWYSVDSTSWVVTGRMGSIYVPRFGGGKWKYDENSWKIAVSNRSPAQKEVGQHINTLSPIGKKIILDYVHEKGYQLGESEFHKEDQTYKLKENEKWAQKKPTDKTAKRDVETILTLGISNRYQLRDEMNIIYFLDLEKSMPEWPWAFKIEQHGLF